MIVLYGDPSHVRNKTLAIVPWPTYPQKFQNVAEIYNFSSFTNFHTFKNTKGPPVTMPKGYLGDRNLGQKMKMP